MKKLKKVLIGSGALILGVTLLGGCAATNNNTPSNNSSNNSSNDKKENTEKKQDNNNGYDTTGLQEKKLKDFKFKTSMIDKWKDSETEDISTSILMDTKTGNSIMLSASKSSAGLGIASWDDKSISTIKESLEKSGFTEVKVENIKVNNKDAFKISGKMATAVVELYYIQLSDSKVASITHTLVKPSDSFTKELKNVVNTIEEV